MPESGKLGAGVGNVHQIGGVGFMFNPLGASQIYDGDLVYLGSGGSVASIGNGASGPSGYGASFIGIANGATPTFGLYGDPETPRIRVILGGIAKLTVVSGTYHIGQPVYINGAGTQVSGTVNGTAIGVIVSPPGAAFGVDPYAGTSTSVFVALAHPGLGLSQMGPIY